MTKQRNRSKTHKPQWQPLNNDQKTLIAELQAVTFSENTQLRKLIYKLSQVKDQEIYAKRIDEIKSKIEIAKNQLLERQQYPLHLNYPEGLPVSQRREEILKLIEKHQIVVIAGETGSGKTTQIPKMCLELGRGRKGLIGHTQPRRIAARAVANRLAEELQTELGDIVGYKVRFNDQVSERSMVKLMTDGILLAEIQNDWLLRQYDTLIIDEAHERSLNNDFILGYLKQVLKKRPDLKLIITSATIDVERFSQHFGNAPIIEVSGRTYPVELRYRPVIERDDQDEMQAIIDAVHELQKEGRGDILIFLNGEREIRDTAQMLEKENLRHTEILPLFARLSTQEQNRIFHPSGLNRIVLATNVAETSLTVPGIKYVIDPGTARISRYSYRTKVQRLPIEAISQASANQRKGRCGRVSEGICIRLYSEDDFNARPMFTDPEILRTNLASVILQMTALGLADIEEFPFIDAPDSRNIKDGIRLLDELQAFKGQGNYQRLSDIGRQLANLPVDPRLGRMIVSAASNNALREVMIIVAGISIQDPRERPQEKQQASDEKHARFKDKGSDFVAYLNLWNYVQEQQKALTNNQFRRLCRQEYLNYLRIREWQDIYQQLRLAVREMGLGINSQEAGRDQIHQSLLSGLLSHVGMKESEKHSYLGARNAHFAIFPNSSLFKKQPKWCMVTELVETSKLWGRTVAEIDIEWVEPLAKHLLKYHYSEPHWSRKRGAVMAKERVTLFGIPIVVDREINYSLHDESLCRELFIRSALVEGDWQTRHKFYQRNLRLIKEVEELEHKSRRRDILVDDQTLFDFYDKHLPSDIVSQRHFDKWWKEAEKTTPTLLDLDKQQLINSDSQQVSHLDFPNQWYQNDLKLKLSYQFEPGSDADGVTVYIPLALLNQIDEQPFQWQIPGLRKELIIALIKSLPKSLRRNFVPAPNYAEAFLSRISSQDKPLIEALSYELRRMTGVTVESDEWQLDSLSEHLKMHFRIIDDQGRKVAESTDLDHLKFSLKEQVQETLSAVADDEIEQNGLHVWSFAELPQQYEQKRRGYSVKAYPAIVDEKHSVGIKLFETEFEQQHAMMEGLRRLLLLNVPSPIKYLREKLPNKAKLGLYFTPYGKVLELIDDCIAAAVDKLIIQHGGMVWNEEQYDILNEFVRGNLNETTVEIAQQVEKILTHSFEITKRLKGKMDFTMAFALADIKQQINALIYPGFVQKSGHQRLNDLDRYLTAIDKRMEKMAQDINRDRANMLKIEHVTQQYQQLLAKLPKSLPVSEDILNIRYMIEELRVSLFAQQLGTAYPVSDKRILQIINNAA